MNRSPSTYTDQTSTSRSRKAELPAWKVTLRRWMPLADPTSYLLAGAILAASWAGPALLDRILSGLAGVP